MRSHRYELSLGRVAAAVLPTLAVAALMIAGLRLANRWGWLPLPAAGWDPESAVLEHQARAVENAPPADMLVLGDSTCLVGVDAAQLQQELPQRPRVLSLALFIWIGLDVYGRELAEFNSHHPGQVRTVVLLVSPMKLEGLGRDTNGAALWQTARHPTRSPGFHDDWLGAHLLRRCFLSYALATPLRGLGGNFYGFASYEDEYMTSHNGSLVAPENSALLTAPRGGRSVKATRRPSALSLLPAVESESRAFRACLPPGTRLCIGLTPGPASRSWPGIAAQRLELLQRWNESVRADVLLTNLPPVLPDLFFSSGGHLNQAGQKQFTAALARELREVGGRRSDGRKADD